MIPHKTTIAYGQRVHWFASSGEAYDGSQTNDDIHDGDLLHAEREGTFAVLVKAWPVAVVGPHGEFHTLAPDVTWRTFEGGKYAAAAEAAHRMAREMGGTE